MPHTIEIPVRLDYEKFKDFANFDVFKLRRRWRLPAAFAVILTAFATVCFVIANDSNQGYLLGGVLLAVGLGLPAAYFAQYYSDIKKQARLQGLTKPRLVYTVLLDEAGVTQRTGGGATKMQDAPLVPWADVFGAWREENAVYLYVAPTRALLLPNGQANVSDARLWAYIQEHLPAEKLHEAKK